MELAERVQKLYDSSPDFRALPINERYRIAKEAGKKRAGLTSADIPWWTTNFPNLFAGTESAIPVNYATAIGISAYHAGVRAVSDGVASMKLRLTKEGKNGKEDLPLHPIMKLLARPNSWQTKFQFRKWLTALQCGRGNSFAWIQRDGNSRPIGLYPINDPDSVWPILQDNQLYYQIGVSQWQYQNIPALVPAIDILHFKGLCWGNSIKALSPVQAHAQTLGAIQSATNAIAKVNKAGKKFGIATTQALNPDQAAALNQSLIDVVDGDALAATVPFGSSLTELSLSPSDAQYLEQGKFGVDEVARMLGVPAYKIGGGNGSNLSAEQEALDFHAETLLAYAINIEEEMEAKLLMESEKGLLCFHHDFDSSMRTTATERADYVTKSVNNGTMTPNQGATLMGLPTYEGGDTYFAMSNLIPMGQFEEWITSKITSNTTKTNNNPNGNNQDNGGM